MISRPELVRIAARKGYRLEAIESDYLQDIALSSITKEFGKKLVFKGGTCLYKVFGLNRFSEDLDFNAVKGFKPKNFFDRMPLYFEQFGFNSRIKQLEEYPNTINVYQEINGPLYNGRKETQTALRLNISLRERILLPTQSLDYSPAHTGLPKFSLCVMQEKEILSEKVRAIYERKKARDVYDLWHLLSARGLVLDIALADKKLLRDAMKYSKQTLMEKISQNEASWQQDLAPLVAGPLPKFQEVQKRIEQLLP